ncbi:MAG: porin [Bdellovibrionota bacterium]
MLKKVFLGIFALLSILSLEALSRDAPIEPKPKTWYERLSFRGYAQLRYNRIGNSDRSLQSDQDRSIGDNSSFFLRRARLILSGDVHDHLFIYLQPDFAASVSGGGVSDANHFAQLRDLYADIAIDPEKEFRFRAGQSKVPYGFENLQSSQNRVPLDRADALNSGVPNERDIGVFFYWAPAEARARFKHLVDSGLKGSGDYGVLGAGVYNGQTVNRSELNNNRHFVARATYPWELAEGGQIIETGLQGYSGQFVPTKSGNVQGPRGFEDWRVGASLVVYPQPLGFQAEYNLGRGPQLNAEQTAVGDAPLRGGYAMVMYRFGSLIPFTRWQYYKGGRKGATNAPAAKIQELEFGIEWQAYKFVELTAMYTFTDRTTTTSPFKNVKDDLARLQLQVSF